MFNTGDYVFHYVDQKHPKMIMVVRGYVGDLVRTRYLHEYFWGEKIHNLREDFLNDEKNLIPVSHYNINPEVKPDDFERVRLWNFYWPVGSVVTLRNYPTLKNGGAYRATSEAHFNAKLKPVIWINGNLLVPLSEVQGVHPDNRYHRG